MTIRSMPSNKAYRDNYDRIFRPCVRDKCDTCKPPEGAEPVVAVLCSACGRIVPPQKPDVDLGKWTCIRCGQLSLPERRGQG